MSESAHSQVLHEPFEDIERQKAAEEAGIWIFLASEAIFFGALFLGYAVYRTRYSDGFLAAGAEVDLTLGLINTFLLLTSSATMALGVWAGRSKLKRDAMLGLGATVALGVAFLAVKAYEYRLDIHHGLIPGSDHFPIEERGAEIFFSFYWLMTATHALHMGIGLAIIGWTVWAIHRERIAWRETAFLHVMGLYWNLVDMVWIFLFPLLYLVGR